MKRKSTRKMAKPQSATDKALLAECERLRAVYDSLTKENQELATNIQALRTENIRLITTLKLRASEAGPFEQKFKDCLLIATSALKDYKTACDRAQTVFRELVKMELEKTPNAQP
jgi:hypothetical protein